MAQKVTIAMGMTTVPARVVTAIRDKVDTGLKTGCQGTKDKPHDPVPVKQSYRCTAPDCDEVRPSWHGWPRIQDTGTGAFKVVTEDALAEAEASEDEKHSLTLLPAPLEQVERKALPNGKFYYVAPGEGPGLQNYGLIRDAIRATVTTHAWLSVWAYKSSPHTVRVYLVDDCIGIQQIAFPEEIVPAPRIEIPPYDERFLPLLIQQAGLLQVDFDATTFRNTRKAKMQEIVAAADEVKAGVSDAAPTPVEATVESELAKLQAWIVENGGTVGGASETPTKAPTKKAAAKKPAAKKAAARKPAVKAA